MFTRGKWTKFYLVDVGDAKFNEFLSQEILQVWDFNFKPTTITLEGMSVSFNEFNHTPQITGVVKILASPDVFVPLIEISEDLEIDVDWGECIECRTRLSGSYSSKIQIRRDLKIGKKTLEKWVMEIEQMSLEFLTSERKNPLFSITYLKNGIDALFRTKSPANTIGRLFAKKYGGLVTVTTEFAGFDKSKSKEYPRKPVVLVTLPPFEIGELVEYNSKIIQIHSFGDYGVEFWDFEKKEWIKSPVKQFFDSKPNKIDYIELELQIIAFEHDGTAQLMSSDNYEIFYTHSSDLGITKEGELIHGYLYNGKMFIKRGK